MSDRFKVVFDTQIFLRALINRNSVCARISTPPLRAHYSLYISNAIEAEITDVLSRIKVRSKFPQITDEIVSATLTTLRDDAERVEVDAVESVSRDPKDDIFLACAKVAKADYLVSEDNDLLVLQKYEDTKIVSAVDFLTLLQSR